MNSTGRVVRLALIGAGRWGRNVIRTVEGIDGAVLARVGSGNPATKNWVGPECAVYEDWRTALDPDAIDGVVIATPPVLHFEMARAAVAARIPVLVEKPLTLDLGEAEALKRAAEHARCIVMVDHVHLFSPAYRALKEMVDVAGPARAIRAIAGDWGPFRPDVSVLWDWGPHDIAMCIDLCAARPEKVDAAYHARRETDEGVGEIVDLQLSFSDHVDASARIGNLIRPKTRYLAVHLDSQLLVYDDMARQKLTVHPPTDGYAAPAGRGRIIDIPDEMPLANIIKTFIMAIRDGSDDRSQLGLAVDVVSVLARCQAALAKRVTPS